MKKVDMSTILLVWIKSKVAKDVSSAIVLKQFTLASTINSLFVGRKEKLGQLNDSNISFSIQYCLSKKTHLNTRWYKHTDSCKMFIVTSYFVFLISVFKSNVHKSDCCQIQNQNV